MQKQVEQFMLDFGQEVKTKPEFPSPEVCDLRVSLIKEELDELDSALQFIDIVGIADALADLLYVVLGTASACGINMEPIFKEVHRSNMSKKWSAAELRASITNISQYGLAEGDNSSAKCYVVKNEHGKVMKSPSFSEPDLLPLLKEQGYVSPYPTDSVE